MKKFDKFRIKIFLWYLITEPFRLIKSFFKKVFIEPLKNSYYWFKKQNNNLMWALMTSIIFTISLAYSKDWLAMISLLIILLIILIVEYNNGYFMYRWREKEKARVKKVLGEKK